MNVLQLDWELESEQEFDDVGSFNHSMVQANLAHQFKLAGEYTVLTELSLDSSALDRSQFNVKDEMIPDVSVYRKRPLSRPFDMLRMSEMPLLVVEVLSPRQWTETLVGKFAAYFALGVQSCWLVDPITESVHVYNDTLEHKTFGQGDIVRDKVDGIQFTVAGIFD